MKRQKLTAERARELLSYDPETGDLTWKVSRGSIKAGHVCRCPGKDGYYLVKIDRVLHSVHRVAWLVHYGAWPDGVVDHINRCVTDNRISNLRESDHSTNHANMKRLSNNTSGYKGVSLHSTGKWWRATLWCRGKVVFYKHFKCKHEAAKAYAEAAREHFGEFARTE